MRVRSVGFVVALVLVGATASLAAQVERVGPVQLNSTVCPPTSAAATGCALLGVGGMGMASFQIVNTSGTWESVIEGSIDGVHFATLRVTASDGSGTVVSQTAGGLWSASVSGYEQVRIRLVTYGSGTVVAYIQASPGELPSAFAAAEGPAVENWLMLLGDSKTDPGFSLWVPQLVAALETSTGEDWDTSNRGQSGTTVLSTVPTIGSKLALMPAKPPGYDVRVLINFGANDVGSFPAEAPWEAGYLSIIDAVHAKWPTARVYLMRMWRRGFAVNSDAVALRISHLIAARPAFVFAGPDERVFLEGGDDGVLETVDGVHYSAFGHTLTAAAWSVVLAS